jgi:iron(III) transport system substrate-binding protein
VLVVYSPHPLEFIAPIIGEFENETGITVEIVSAGTGELLARIESEDQPYGDVLWGGSLSTLESKKELFEIYYSDNEEHAIYKNTDGRITRFTMMPSVIMINTNLVGDIKITGYNDLLNPQLKGKIAYADPLKSSSSFEQLLNQIWAMGQGDMEKGWGYIEELAQNLEGKLLDSSSSVYNGVAQGEYVVGLTFEEAAAKYVESGAPVEIIYPVEGTIIRPDGVSIIKNAKNIENAQKFIDFVTSQEIQRFIATTLNRRSIRDDVVESKGLVSYEDIYIIKDNQEWSSNNKSNILDRYNKMFREMYK